MSCSRAPAVTVLLPVHNGAAYLPDALASLLGQSFTDFEVVVVDDCSSDDSAAIVRTCPDRRVRLIESPVRLGICKALNVGLDQSTGQFVARMDADDICHLQRLEKQVACLSKHPDIGICGAWVRRFGAGTAPRLDTRPTDFESLRAYALFDNPLIHSTVMLRRELIDKFALRYDDAFRHAEDYDLWTRLFASTRAVNIPAPLLDYRVHSASVTLGTPTGMDEAACRVVTRLLTAFGLEPSPEEVLFHRHAGTHRLYPTPTLDSLAHAEQWFNRLVQHNNDAGVYDRRSFRRVTGDAWFALCYHTINLGPAVPRQFWASDLARGRLVAKLTMAYASFMRRQKQNKSRT